MRSKKTSILPRSFVVFGMVAASLASRAHAEDGRAEGAEAETEEAENRDAEPTEHAEAEHAEEAASSGFLSLDLTAGAGYGYVQHPSYDWVHGGGLLPRAGIGARAHLGDWRVGIDVNGTYTPSMDFEGFFALNPGYGYSYAEGAVGIVGGYVGGPLVCEVEVGPAFVFAQGGTAVGVDARLFTAFEMRFGMLALAVGPALSAGWTKGLNLNAMLLVRPSLVFGS